MKGENAPTHFWQTFEITIYYMVTVNIRSRSLNLIHSFLFKQITCIYASLVRKANADFTVVKR